MYCCCSAYTIDHVPMQWSACMNKELQEMTYYGRNDDRHSKYAGMDVLWECPVYVSVEI